MVMSRVQKKIADRFMCMAIHNHVKKTYFKKGVHPTVEQVIQNIDKQALNILHSQGYTEDKIKEIVEESIRRQECKE